MITIPRACPSPKCRRASARALNVLFPVIYLTVHFKGSSAGLGSERSFKWNIDPASGVIYY